VRLSNLQVLNAVLYVAEQGCKWRGLPKRFGRWHTIYTRMNRWSKNGVLHQVFEKLQSEQIVRINIEAFALDSTLIKVHPDGTGALKKRTSSHRQVARRMEHQGSSAMNRAALPATQKASAESSPASKNSMSSSLASSTSPSSLKRFASVNTP
jgi:transposase